MVSCGILTVGLQQGDVSTNTEWIALHLFILACIREPVWKNNMGLYYGDPFYRSECSKWQKPESLNIKRKIVFWLREVINVLCYSLYIITGTHRRAW